MKTQSMLSLSQEKPLHCLQCHLRKFLNDPLKKLKAHLTKKTMFIVFPFDCMKTLGIILPQTLFSQIQDQSECIKRKGQADLQMVRFPL